MLYSSPHQLAQWACRRRGHSGILYQIHDNLSEQVSPCRGLEGGREGMNGAGGSWNRGEGGQNGGSDRGRKEGG